MQPNKQINKFVTVTSTIIFESSTVLLLLYKIIINETSLIFGLYLPVVVSIEQQKMYKRKHIQQTRDKFECQGSEEN